jgi:hypothetical protein
MCCPPGHTIGPVDAKRMCLQAAEKHNPVPGTPLINHYFLDFSLVSF